MIPGRLVDDDGLPIVLVTGRVARDLNRHLQRVFREARRDGLQLQPETLAVLDRITDAAIAYQRARDHDFRSEARAEGVEQGRPGAGSLAAPAERMLVNVSTAADLTGLGERRVRQLIEGRVLTSYRTPRGHHRLDPDELDSYIANRRSTS